jgi:hypothetical protein
MRAVADEPLVELLAALVRAGIGPADRPRVESPYPGLHAFDEDHARFFLGRQAATGHLVAT